MDRKRVEGWEGRVNLKLKHVTLRQLGGIVMFIAGGVLIFWAIDAMRRIAAAKNTSHHVSNFFEHNPTWNPVVKFFGGKAQEKISQYDLPVMVILIVGIVFVILGVTIFRHYRAKKFK
jgi:MFS superfamily sulfate permease-like transporter